MTLLRLSISRNFSDSFFFLSFFPFFAPVHFPCIGPSWRRNETGTKRGRIGTDFCFCPFPWYCDCAISDELVKLAQSAVRLHVAVHPPCHPSFRSVSILAIPCFLRRMAGEPQTIQASTAFLRIFYATYIIFQS